MTFKLRAITPDVIGFLKGDVPQECPNSGKLCSNRCPFFSIIERTGHLCEGGKETRLTLSCRSNIITIVIDKGGDLRNV